MNQIQDTEYIEVIPGTDIFFSMIKVEGGEFEMSTKVQAEAYSQDVIHRVKLDYYYIGKFPVTQQVWKAVMGNDKNPSFFMGNHRPVENIDWEETQIFLKKLNRMRRRNYRLPTEAEWEFAARGGNLSKDYEYVGSNEIRDVGWFEGNSHRETKDVGQKFANELGIYDMSGNVWEWCQDWFSGEYYQACKEKGLVVNPSGPANGSRRVIRGGSWIDAPQYCRSAFRDNWRPEGQSNLQGFRLAFSFQSGG